MARDISNRRVRGLAVVFALGLGLAGCGGAQTAEEGTTPPGAPAEETPAAEEEGGAASDSDDDAAGGSPVCVAYDSDEVDPLRRWVHAFPIQRGGAVLVFVGPDAARMDVEMSMEMAGIMGYEVETCGTAVIVWVPGLECNGDHTALVERVEAGTSMVGSQDTHCFAIDEVRLRLREECARGNITGDACP